MPSALRSLLKAPGFTVIAVLTLAIGLGANTAIFSAVYAILLKPLPFPESDRLVSVRTVVQRETRERRGFSNPDFRDYRAQATHSFEAMAAMDGANFNLTGEGEATRLRGEIVSQDYFRVLGAQPALGRTFDAGDDDAPDRPPLVILSDAFWRTHFAGAHDVLGRTLKLTDIDYTIVGVMPPTFHGMEDSAQLWVPMSTIGAATWNDRGSRGREAIGRLKPGVTLEQARAELSAIGRTLAARHPGTNAGYTADAAPLREEFFGDLRQPLLVLLGAVGFVLFITCANVANLLLVRLAARHREIAVRVSLGASRGALARLFLGESFALSLLGGGLGLLLAAWGIDALRRLAPVELPDFVAIELHAPVFGFALAVTLLCALAIGALPALLAARTDLNAALKDGGRTASSGAGGARLRASLVTAELALSLALLVSSSLFIRSFVNLVTQAPGYRTDKILFQRVLLPPQRYTPEARRQFARTLLERTAALPGVDSAALATDTPLDGNVVASLTTVEGGSSVPAENETRAHRHVVTRGFFASMGMTLLHGETFAPAYEAASEPVVIVSEKYARRFWPNGDAVGRRLKIGRTTSTSPWLRIVGVVAEAKYRALSNNGPRDPDYYLAMEQQPAGGFSVLVHTTGDSRSLGASVRQLIATLDPNVPVFSLATIEERIAQASAGLRFTAQLMGSFAIVALVLAAIGLYGVVSFSVGQRTQEIGVRLALGAQPADIARLILGGTSRLVAVGLLAGTALAVGLTRFVETMLFNVNPRDPLAYGLVAGVLALVALLAAWLPARRATKVDPMTALRAE